MERQPKQPEWLNSKGRQKLSKLLATEAGWLRPQYALMSKSFREDYIPLLATGRLVMEKERQQLEEEHLRKMLAIQAVTLSNIPLWIGGTSELHQFIETEAGLEVEQWRHLSQAEKLPQPWKNAQKDTQKLAALVALAEEE
jgi:hypothetical protein